MSEFSGKVALVTGGARDIGRQCSLKLAQMGASVCINYFQSKEKAEKTLEMIERNGGRAIISYGDLTKEEDVLRVVDDCRRVLGEDINYLVNVAGGLVGRKLISEIDLNFWRQVIDLNLTSAFMMTKAVLSYMPAGGAIVNLSSLAARDGGGTGSTAYAVSKGAILTLTRSLAKELGPRKIRVNAVSPGLINTTFHDTFTKPEVRLKVASATPLQREGESAEVGEAVIYLLSDRASFITGASLEINGGLYFI